LKKSKKRNDVKTEKPPFMGGFFWFSADSCAMFLKNYTLTGIKNQYILMKEQNERSFFDDKDTFRLPRQHLSKPHGGICYERPAF